MESEPIIVAINIHRCAIGSCKRTVEDFSASDVRAGEEIRNSIQLYLSSPRSRSQFLRVDDTSAIDRTVV
jgi:hypothetical protein